MLKLFVSLQNTLANLRDREDGQAFAEYGVLLAIVAIGCIAMLIVFRTSLADAFKTLGGKVNGAIGQ
jgi:Flp pilus assembly pilin Flp